jgi:hypothetical protein
MTDYKDAGQLVPGDIFVVRRQRGRELVSMVYRVTGTAPGLTSTVIEVSVARLDRPWKCAPLRFFRSNRVELAARPNVRRLVPRHSAARKSG